MTNKSIIKEFTQDDLAIARARRARNNKGIQAFIKQVREQTIRDKAYHIWATTGNPDPVANWLLAEQQIISQTYPLGDTYGLITHKIKG